MGKPKYSNSVRGAQGEPFCFVGKLASGDPQKKHTPREARGKKYGYKPGHMMGKAFIGEDSARSAEKNNFLGKPKLGSSEGFSDRPGLGKNKETPREAREKNMSFAINSS